MVRKLSQKQLKGCGINLMWQRIQEWFRINKDRLYFFFGLLLVGILCFEAGLLQGKIGEKTSVVLSVPPMTETPTVPILDPSSCNGEVLSRAEPIATIVDSKTNCAFVGSKNSNKYHLPSCTAAKRIKPENRICFTSKEEAEKRGYVPSCLK